MWTILNLSWISYNIACFLKNLRFWFFGCEAHGILAPQPGIEPTPSALEGEVLNTGPPGKSHERSPLLKEISSPSWGRVHDTVNRLLQTYFPVAKEGPPVLQKCTALTFLFFPLLPSASIKQREKMRDTSTPWPWVCPSLSERKQMRPIWVT